MKAEQLLKKYIAFAVMDKDSPALKKRANALIWATRVFQRGDVESHPAGTLSEEKALSLHEILRGTLVDMARGSEVRTSAIKLSARFKNGEGVRLTTDYGDSPEGTVLTLYFAIREAGVKAILRCPGCGCIFLRTKGRRKTCSGKCRAKKCAENRTPEQKEQLRKKRQERYLISKGGNK